MSKLLRPTFVDIQLEHLKSNLNFFMSSPLAKKFFCPMVKANAYGHGDLAIVKCLEAQGCSTFGVGLVEEGIHLREAGRALSQILVFGFSGREAAKELLHFKLTPVVSDWDQLENLSDLAKEKISIHLKWNTGMHRLGFPVAEFSKVIDFVKEAKNLQIKGLCTHLATSENLSNDGGSALEQIQLFKKTIEGFNGSGSSVALHVYNTEGAVRAMSDELISNAYPYGFRIGLGLYGLSTPVEEWRQKLLPVMSLKTKVVSVQKVKKGRSVSYGGTWTAPKDSIVGIVPVGYADGIPTQLSNRGEVMIEGRRYPIVGRVCMDYTLIDVTDLFSPHLKDVEFFGSQISADEVANTVGTITYDILTRLSERVPRVLSGGPR